MTETYLYLEPGEQPLSAAEAAAFLGVSMGTVTRLFKLGQVQASKYGWEGREWRTTPAALKAYRAEKNASRRSSKK